ncbi:MAG: single-stranded DNA-binding protein [Acidimicrobiales bacterium]
MTAPPETTSKSGNLTNDPEIGESKSGTTYCRFRMATESPLTPGDWRGEKEANYFSVVCFGSTATHAHESLRKGDRVVVSGREEVEEWTKDGQVHKTTKIVANAVGADLLFANVSIDRTRGASRR